jgi:hypothetical protein
MTTQDNQPKESNEENDETQKQNVAKWELALSILREAVTAAGVKDISEFKGEPNNLRWEVYSHQLPKDVVLEMSVRGGFGEVHANVSLITTAVWIMDEVGRILNRPDANQLLDFTDAERPELLRENTGMIITNLVKRMPAVAFQLLNQAFQDAIDSHLKTYIEPLLKEHWQALGKPKDFTITPSGELNEEFQNADEQFKVLREVLRGNKRAGLTKEKRANLDTEHEELRSAYHAAKEYYDQTRKAFFAGRRNREIDEWEEEWRTLSLRMFPDLFYRCLYEINDYQPFELAHIHLADSYGSGVEYIKKLVSRASKARARKAE